MKMALQHDPRFGNTDGRLGLVGVGCLGQSLHSRLRSLGIRPRRSKKHRLPKLPRSQNFVACNTSHSRIGVWHRHHGFEFSDPLHHSTQHQRSTFKARSLIVIPGVHPKPIIQWQYSLTLLTFFALDLAPRRCRSRLPILGPLTRQRPHRNEISLNTGAENHTLFPSLTSTTTTE